MGLVVLCLAAASIGAGVFTPAFAQRYPPFPIGPDGTGGTGNTGTGNTGTGNTSGSGTEFFNPGNSSGGGSGGSGGAGTANADDGPACDLEHCLRFAGEVGGAFVTGKVEQLSTLHVAAIEGCCEAFARVDVYVESERVFLGTVFATEDGSYHGVFKLPASIEPGLHHIVADVEGCGEFRGALEVLDEGASVLGTSVANTSRAAGASGGILPRTGQDFLRVLLWALILIALGTALTVAARRFAPVAVDAGGRRRDAIAALPLPEVPFVDTSRFVPYRSAPGQRPAGAGPSIRTPRTRPAQTTQRDRTSTAWERAPKNEPLS